MIVHALTPAEWSSMSEDAHKVVFGKLKPASWDRIDFALVAENAGGLVGYLTAREVDHETLYWQFGGAFPGTKGTVNSFPAYRSFLEWCKPRYKRITTLIENDNTVMLKMAMKVGFRIIGVRNFKGSILLEHLVEFEGGQ